MTAPRGSPSTRRPVTTRPSCQRSVSLSKFAKKPILLRFRVQYAGGSVFIFDPEGWYIDDISIGNTQVAGTTVTSGVLPGTAFSFTPNQTAEYDLQVRANFPGSGFGAWSNSKRVSTYASSTLPQALDAPQFTWSTTGSPAWAGQTAVTQDGVDALRSGAIGNSASTSFQTTVVGVTKLKFWWRSDSDAGDFLQGHRRRRRAVCRDLGQHELGEEDHLAHQRPAHRALDLQPGRRRLCGCQCGVRRRGDHRLEVSQAALVDGGGE